MMPFKMNSVHGMLMLMLTFDSVQAKFEEVGLARGASWETCESTGSCVPEDDAPPPKPKVHIASSHADDACFDAFPDGDCIDYMEENGFATMEEACIMYFDEMSEGCRRSCHLCGNLEETTARTLLHSTFSRDHPQSISGDKRQEILEWHGRVENYMFNQVYQTAEYNDVKAECQNRHELCLFWAAAGECDANPSYMKMQCAPSCMSCEDLSFKSRCPYDPNTPTAWSKQDDLDNMFRRIVTEPQFQQYEPNIIAQPDPPAQKDGDENTILNGPWVVTLDNFLSDEECDALISLGAGRGYELSRDVGEKLFDGTYDGKENPGRTSTNAWCTEDCWEHNVTQAVHERIENVIQIPRGNYEHLQLLRYEKGQRYEEHHDYIEHHLERFPGVRILTVFLYLNDVEAGGGTHFPRLNKTVVYPKRGRALLWPSVLNSDPNKRDARTHHEALPVEEGVKYGANAWVHQRDFKEVWQKGCH